MLLPGTRWLHYFVYIHLFLWETTRFLKIRRNDFSEGYWLTLRWVLLCWQLRNLQHYLIKIIFFYRFRDQLNLSAGLLYDDSRLCAS
jgi:hypothetical protein